MIYRQRCQLLQASIYPRLRIWQGIEHQLPHFSKLGLWSESQGLFWTWVKSHAYFWPKHSCRKDAMLPLARPRGHIPSRKGGSILRVGWMDTEKPKKQLLPPQYDHKYFFPLLSFLRRFSLSGVLGVCSSQAQVQGRHGNHVCWDSQATALPEVMAKVQRKPTQELHSNSNCAAEAGAAELPRRLWKGTMTGCRQLCRQLETRQWGWGSGGKAGGGFYLLHAWQGPLPTASIWQR